MLAKQLVPAPVRNALWQWRNRVHGVALISDEAHVPWEMLLLAPSMLVPSLEHQGVRVWDTLAIGEYLNEIKPRRACCRPTRRRARTAAPSAARCIRASPPCAARCP